MKMFPHSNKRRYEYSVNKNENNNSFSIRSLFNQEQNKNGYFSHS